MSTRIEVIHATGTHAVEALKRFRPLLEGREVREVDTGSSPSELGEVEAVLTLYPPQIDWSPARRLRLFQAMSVGTDRLLPLDSLRPEAVVANSAGLSSRPMAEYALAAFLMLAKRFPDASQLQAERRWKRTAPLMIEGLRVAVLGLGPVGRRTAELLNGVGVTCVGFRRRGGAVEGLAETHTLDDLHDLLPTVAGVIITLPLTPATRHVISHRELSAMKPGAFLVNVARGGLVDETALSDALREGTLGGAVLDVVEEEPLPPTSPLWKVPNLHLTAHVSWTDPNYFMNTVKLFVDNLGRLERGEPIRNVLDTTHGYPLGD